MNPFPRKGYWGENLTADNCWIWTPPLVKDTEGNISTADCRIDYDSWGSWKKNSYCRLISTTVGNQEWLATTAVSERFPSRITVVWAGFVGYDCHQAMKNESKLQCSRKLFAFLLSVQKNQLLKWQYAAHLFGFVLQFHMASTVDNQQCRIWTVAPDYG